jgi:osmotically inducible lipoprotein OsmB
MSVFTRKSGLVLASIALLGMSGCANMNSTEQRMLSGGAAGAVVGTVGTVMTGGCVACGAAIGGAVGTGAGYLIDQAEKDKGR